MTKSDIASMERELADARRQLDRENAANAREREAEAQRARYAKRGITILRPVIYKGAELEQLTNGDAPYIVYERRATVPYFVFRDDGTMICSCAFRVAAIGAATELNKLAAIAAGTATATPAA